MSAVPLAALLLASPAFAGKVRTVPPVGAPVSPSPAVRQLVLDLSALKAADFDAAPPAQLGIPPAAWANMGAVLRLPGGPVSLGVAGAAPDREALSRVALARDLLGTFDPEAFQKMPDGEKDAVMSRLWEGWKAKGLVAEPGPSEQALAGLDGLVVQAFRDKELTSRNKSIFLGVAVLGYPLQDALWLARTPITDARHDNTINYPLGQKWLTADGTPEVLGLSAETQGLVDVWGAAVGHGRQIIRQVRVGSTRLPKGPVDPAAAAAFARLIEGLLKNGDQEAVSYLSNEDPTFAAFLLDARKPGYFLYNGEGSVVNRILRSPGAAGLGIRRMENPDEWGSPIGQVYYYRPGRVRERLKEVIAQPAQDGEMSNVKARMALYSPRWEALASALSSPKSLTEPFTFAPPETLPGSVLESPANRVPAELARTFSRYELPFTVGLWRERLAAENPIAALSPERWKALGRLFEACPALEKAAAGTPFHIVSETHRTKGGYISALPGGGVVINLAALDRIVELGTKDDKSRREFLAFAAVAVEGALLGD